MSEGMPTILIAENDSQVRKLLSTVLRNAGYEVISASGGERAVSAAQKHGGKIDLLIADIVMPGMGGADLYAWLKTERPDTRVLFISGYMSRQPLPGGFLKKPFSSATLVEKVREILETQGETERSKVS
jgi:CheY-like chemotaxis protein